MRISLIRSIGVLTAVMVTTAAAPEVICDWHNVDGHAVYTFYHDALPKAGYTLLPGAQEVLTPHYMGAIDFTKGDIKGAVTIPGTDVTIQVITGQ